MAASFSCPPTHETNVMAAKMDIGFGEHSLRCGGRLMGSISVKVKHLINGGNVI